MTTPSHRSAPAAGVSVEVLWSPHQDAVENFLTLDVTKHRVIPHSFIWLDWLKRQTGNHNLFVYHHLWTGRFVLCTWVFDPSKTTRPVAQELELFSAPPNSFWPEDLMAPGTLVARLAPVDQVIEQMQASRRQAQSMERSGRDSYLNQKKDYITHVRRQGLTDYAHRLQNGQSPYATRDQNPAMYDRIRSMWS